MCNQNKSEYSVRHTLRIIANYCVLDTGIESSSLEISIDWVLHELLDSSIKCLIDFLLMVELMPEIIIKAKSHNSENGDKYSVLLLIEETISSAKLFSHHKWQNIIICL